MKLIEWIGSIMLLIGALEFLASPRAALSSITEVLSTNIRIEQGHLGLQRPAVHKSSAKH